QALRDLDRDANQKGEMPADISTGSDRRHMFLILIIVQPRRTDYPILAALPSSPSLSAIGFRASMQKLMCSSRSTPRSVAPLMMSSRFTLRAKALSFILFRTDLAST